MEYGVIDKIVYTVLKPHSEEELEMTSTILSEMDIHHKKGESSIVVDTITEDSIYDVLTACDNKGMINILAHIVYYGNGQLNNGVLNKDGFATDWDMV